VGRRRCAGTVPREAADGPGLSPRPERTSPSPSACLGILLQRIATVVDEHRAVLPDIELVLAPHLGAHPALIGLVLRRVREARAGEARSHCDLCKYRVRLPGFAHDHGRPQGSDHAHGLHGHYHHPAHTHHEHQ